VNRDANTPLRKSGPPEVVLAERAIELDGLVGGHSSGRVTMQMLHFAGSARSDIMERMFARERPFAHQAEEGFGHGEKVRPCRWRERRGPPVQRDRPRSVSWVAMPPDLPEHDDLGERRGRREEVTRAGFSKASL